MSCSYASFYKKVWFFLFFILTNAFAHAQSSHSITGHVQNEVKQPLSEVIVNLYELSDSTFITSCFTNNEGEFELRFLPSKSYFLELRLIGFERKVVPVLLSESDFNIQTIQLDPLNRQLEIVEVNGVAMRVSTNGDTTVYNANAYKVNPDANAIDLIQKMPGIQVDGDKVQAHGEDVRKVTVDGEAYFGDDVQIALKNLPADIISEIQVYDGQSDQAKLTGFQDPNTLKTINIVTKNQGGQLIFGTAFAGYGLNNRFNMGGNLNSFYGKRKITVIGASNNINDQNFSNQIMSNSTSGQNFRGAPPTSVGGGVSPFSRPSMNQYATDLEGVSATSSFGINYIDRWGGNTKVSANYFFYRNKNLQIDQTNRTFLFPDTSDFSFVENDNDSTRVLNHRLSLKFEIDLNKRNKLIITPQLSFQNGSGLRFVLSENRMNTIVINNSETTLENENKGLKAGTNLLFVHQMRSTGRTVSLNLNVDHNSADDLELQGYQLADYQNELDTNLFFKQNTTINSHSSSYAGTVNYTEPLSKRLSLLCSYNFSALNTGNERYNYILNEENGNYDIFNTDLSNHIKTHELTHSVGANLQWRGQKARLIVGLFARNTTQEGQYELPNLPSITQRYLNLLPSAIFMHQFSKQTNLRLFMQSGTTLPTTAQLQEVVDNSNPQQLVKGNSELKQEKFQMLMIRFAHTNLKKGRSFFAFLMLQHKNNVIGNDLTISRSDTVLVGDVSLPPNTQLLQYSNYKHSINARSFLTYGFPLRRLKSNLNINAGVNYSVTPGETNTVLNLATLAGVNGGIVLSSNISEAIDFTCSYSINQNWILNSILSQNNTTYTIQKATLKFNYIHNKRIVFATSSTLHIYSGIGNLANNNPLLVNAALAYKFLSSQQLEIRLTAYDLLNQNVGISRTVSPAFIDDTEQLVLNRYALLKITYRFRNT